MKYILIIIAALILGFDSAGEPRYGPPNPSIYSNPVFEYIQSNDVENWKEVEDNTINDQEFMKRIAWRFNGNFHLDECLYTDVLPYNTDVVWHFSTSFEEEDDVFIVLVNRDYILTNIIKGHPLPDGTVLFDFSLVDGDVYYFFEFSNHKGGNV